MNKMTESHIQITTLHLLAERCAKKVWNFKEDRIMFSKNKGEALLLSQQKDKNWNIDPAILIEINLCSVNLQNKAALYTSHTTCEPWFNAKAGKSQMMKMTG